MASSLLVRVLRVVAVTSACAVVLGVVAVPATAEVLSQSSLTSDSPLGALLNGKVHAKPPAVKVPRGSQAQQGGVFRPTRNGRVVAVKTPHWASRVGVATRRKVASGAETASDASSAKSLALSPHDVTPPPAGVFVPLPLARVTPGGVTVPASGAGDPVTVAVTGNVDGDGVPSTGVTAVALNVTAFESGSQNGDLKVYPAGEAVPATADVAYPSGQYQSAMVVTAVNSAGQIAIDNENIANQSVTVYVDVEGYYAPSGSGAGFVPLSGVRVLDTTTGLGNGGVVAPVTPASPVTIQVAGGASGVPAGVTSVAVNLEAVHPSSVGFLAAYPTGSTPPSGVDEVAVTTGQNVDTLAQVAVGSGNQITIETSTSTDLRVDIEGYTTEVSGSPEAGNFTALDPLQLIATEVNTTSGVPLSEKVTDQGSDDATNVPATASAVMVDVGVDSAAAAGSVRVYPAGGPPPSETQVNFVSSGAATNTVIVAIGNNGKILLRPDLSGGSGTVNLSLRVEGYYTNAPALPGLDGDSAPYLGNENYWSATSAASVGPQSAASVNVSDGNLVVSATDSTPVAAHGHLDYVIRRTYNSLDDPGGSAPTLLEGLSGALTPGSIGTGWTLNLGGFGTGVDGLGVGITNLLTPDWQLDTNQQVTAPLLPANQVILVDQDGSRHLFTQTQGGTLSLDGHNLLSSGGAGVLTGLGATLGSLFTGSSLGDALSSLVGNVCVDQVYAPPAGVHLSMWRLAYIGSPGSGTNACTPSSGTSVSIGYVAERPDGLRFVYSATGQLIDEVDRAGTDLRFVYGTGGGLGSLLNQLGLGSLGSGNPLPLLSELRGVYEANVPGCTAASGSVPAAPCRAIRISYSNDGTGTCTADGSAPYAVCVSDPAGRTTIYDLDGTPGSSASPHLIQVHNPDGSTVHYAYGTACSGSGAQANQLCSITDPRGNTTTMSYDGASAFNGSAGAYPDASNGPLLVAMTDRRGNTTNFTYDLGQLSAELPAAPGFPSLGGLSSTTEVTHPNVSGSCTVNSPASAACRIDQYTGIDSAGRVGEHDRGLVAGAAPCSAAPSAPQNGGGICAQQITETTWDTAPVATPATPIAVAGTSGTLSAATYGYRVAAVAGPGQTLASAEVTVATIGSSGSVALSWAPVLGATSYQVYGRTPGAELRLATVSATLASGATLISFTDDGSRTPSGALPTANTTASDLCEQDDVVMNNPCAVLQYGLNDASTGETNHVYTPNRLTTYAYGPDGSMLSSDVAMAGSPDIQTSYGYRYQYWMPDGSATLVVHDLPAGSGVVSPDAGLPAPPTVGNVPAYLYLIADQTKLLSPRGNAAGSGYAAFETSYHPDDLDTVAPNTLQSGSGDPQAAAVCSTHTASGGAATSNTGVNCETDSPAPHGTGAPQDCQAASGFTCVTFTYDGWGQKTSMTTALAHTAAAGAGEYDAYRYRYAADSTTDVSGTTSAGGWLTGVADPTAGLNDTSTAAAVGAVTRHFVAYGYDAAGDTVWTWDRLAIQSGAGHALSAFPGTESGGAAHPVEAGQAITLYGSSRTVSDLYAAPWRYVVSSATPLGETTASVVNANGDPTTVTDPRGNATTNVYDANDELTSTTLPLGSSGGGTPGTTTYTYNADGDPITTTDPRGTTSYATYTSLDQVSETINPRAASAPGHAPANCTQDATGFDSTFDCLTTTVYDGFGQPVETTDADGGTTFLFYDADGRQIAQSVAYGFTTAAPTQASLDHGASVVANDLNTAWVLDADGNPTQTCTPRDFDGIDGAVDNNVGDTGVGTNVPGSAAALNTLLSDCVAVTPLYGSKDSYDDADDLTTAITYRAAPATADVAGVPAGATALTTTASYDADGNQTATLDPAGNAGVAPNASAIATTVSYDLLDRATSQSVPREANGVSTTPTSWLYDDSGDLTATTAPPADAVDAEGGSGNAARITDAVYDLDHRMTKQVSDATSTTVSGAWTSDAADQQNLITSYSYDADGDVTQVFDPRATVSGASHPSDDSVGITYDVDDRATAVYSPRYDTSITGTPSGSIQSTECPTGSAPSGFAFASTTGVCVTSYTYDADSNQATVTLPTQTGNPSADNRVLTYHYTLDNLVSSITAPDPSSTSHATETAESVDYNGKGQPVAVTDADGETSLTAYALNGTQIFSSDDNGTADATTTISDANGDPTATAVETSGAGWVSGASHSYQTSLTPTNSDGTVLASTQASADPVLSSYSYPTVYAYDRDGNPTTITSPDGYPTTDTYTADGLLASTTRQVSSATDLRTTSYVYDPAGRKESQDTTQTGKTDAGAQCFSYYPDDLAYTQSTRVASCSNQSSAKLITDSYDAAGNEIGVTDSATTGYGNQVNATYYLDSLLASTKEGTGYSEQLTYDGAGSLASRATTTSGATQTLSFLDNDAGLQTAASGNQVNSSGGKQWAWTYDKAGLNTAASYPNGETVTNTYNANETLASTALTNGATNVGTYSYSYDLAKRVLTQTRTGTTETGQPGQNAVLAYLYDSAGRVCEYSDTETTPRTVVGIKMDGDGNRTSYGSTAPSGNCVGAIAVTGSTTGMYSYNRDDTIASGPPGGNICAANTSYSYDSDGRLTFDGDNTYSYDGFDNTTGISTLQLSCAKVALASTTYTYDGLGRQATSVSSLVSGTDTMGDDGLSSALLTETQGGLLNLGLLSTMIDYPRDANGSPLAVADNSVTGSGHGTGSGAVTQYISDDGNGSVGTVSTTAGGLACVLRYTPYGTQLTSDGCTSTPNKYQGTLSYTSAHTDETGDFQDGTRFYNPALDAYTTPDRYGPSATNADRSVGIDPLTADTYNYVNGDPINLTDFTGHSWYNPVDDYHTVVSHVEQYSGDAYDAVTGAGGDVLGYLFDLPSQIASGLDKVGAAITSGAKAVTHAAKTVATTAIKVGITSNEVVADLAGGILAGATNTLVSVGTLGAVHTHLSLCAFGGGAIGTACTVGRYTGDALAYAGLAVATGGAGEAAEAAEAGELAAEGTEASLAAEDTEGAESCLLNSFTPSTGVKLASGKVVPISTIKVGERVQALYTLTGKAKSERVTKLWKTRDDALMNIVVDVHGKQLVIHDTAHHLIYDTTQRGWVETHQLRPGDTLRAASGRRAPTVVRTLVVPGVRDMWDLTVHGTHDFYVETGRANVLVHNCGDPSLDSEGEAYVRGKHFPGGEGVDATKGVFNSDEDPYALAEAARGSEPVGPNEYGNYERTVNAGRIVGNASEVQGGLPTSSYMVAHDFYGGVQTMYPIPEP